MERRAAQVHAGIAEGVQIAAAKLPPVDEFDPQLERARRAAQEIVLVDAENGVEPNDLRNRRLTHANRADQFGFDQLDCQALAQQPCEGRSSDPPCCAAANDH
jgi:hypothetical protein